MQKKDPSLKVSLIGREGILNCAFFQHSFFYTIQEEQHVLANEQRKLATDKKRYELQEGVVMQLRLERDAAFHQQAKAISELNSFEVMLTGGDPKKCKKSAIEALKDNKALQVKLKQMCAHLKKKREECAILKSNFQKADSDLAHQRIMAEKYRLDAELKLSELTQLKQAVSDEVIFGFMSSVPNKSAKKLKAWQHSAFNSESTPLPKLRPQSSSSCHSNFSTYRNTISKSNDVKLEGCIKPMPVYYELGALKDDASAGFLHKEKESTSSLNLSNRTGAFDLPKNFKSKKPSPPKMVSSEDRGDASIKPNQTGSNNISISQLMSAERSAKIASLWGKKDAQTNNGRLGMNPISTNCYDIIPSAHRLDILGVSYDPFSSGTDRLCNSDERYALFKPSALNPKVDDLENMDILACKDTCGLKARNLNSIVTTDNLDYINSKFAPGNDRASLLRDETPALQKGSVDLLGNKMRSDFLPGMLICL